MKCSWDMPTAKLALTEGLGQACPTRMLGIPVMQGTYSKIYNYSFLIMSTVWIFEDQEGREWEVLRCADAWPLAQCGLLSQEPGCISGEPG